LQALKEGDHKESGDLNAPKTKATQRSTITCCSENDSPTIRNSARDRPCAGKIKEVCVLNPHIGRKTADLEMKKKRSQQLYTKRGITLQRGMPGGTHSSNGPNGWVWIRIGALTLVARLTI